MRACVSAGEIESVRACACMCMCVFVCACVCARCVCACACVYFVREGVCVYVWLRVHIQISYGPSDLCFDVIPNMHTHVSM